MTNAIITGSHAYGVPTESSDIDLAVLVSKADWDLLVKAEGNDPAGEPPEPPEYSNPRSLRFGKLNLLICTDQVWLDAWREGTDRLKKIAPVERTVAVAMFQSLFAKVKAEIRGQ